MLTSVIQHNAYPPLGIEWEGQREKTRILTIWGKLSVSWWRVESKIFGHYSVDCVLSPISGRTVFIT